MEVINTDLAIIGGGTAGCISAYEAKKLGLSSVIIDKAKIKRSGCLAMGVNAIYSYLNNGESIDSYVEWLRFQGMGLLKENLARTMIPLSRYAVKILEDYGLPTTKEKVGKFGLRIFGEHIKPILADIAYESADVFEKCYAIDLAIDNGVKGVYVYDLKNDEIFFVKSKATLIASGGANLYKPYSIPWYPPSNSGSGYALAIRAGAEITSFEIRFIPIRIKDVNSPIGITAVGFNARVKNVFGEEFMKKWSEYCGERAPISIRVYAALKEIIEGRFPIYIDARGLNKDQISELIKLYLNGWPMFLLFLKAREIDLSNDMLEIQPCEPYITGSHTIAGIWVDENRMTSIKYLLSAGDSAGGLPLKHVGGALAEGIIAARTASKINAINDYEVKEMEINNSGDYDVGEAEERMYFVLDNYAGGMSRMYLYNESSTLYALKEIEKLLSLKFSGKPLRTFELRDRLEVARVMLYHMIERRETRMPPFQMRSDYPEISNSNYMLVSKLSKSSKVVRFRRETV